MNESYSPSFTLGAISLFWLFTLSFYRSLGVRVRMGLGGFPYTTCARDNAEQCVQGGRAMVSTNHLNLPRGTGLELGISSDRFGRGESLD